jgi:hypothetical protein
MFTIRNLGGVALFLFGTTYLWLTPMFARRGISTEGLWWSVTQVLALGTPWFNVLIHAVGAIGVLVLLTVPALASWVDGHVMAGK